MQTNGKNEDAAGAYLNALAHQYISRLAHLRISIFAHFHIVIFPLFLRLKFFLPWLHNFRKKLISIGTS